MPAAKGRNTPKRVAPQRMSDPLLTPGWTAAHPGLFKSPKISPGLLRRGKSPRRSDMRASVFNTFKKPTSTNPVGKLPNMKFLSPPMTRARRQTMVFGASTHSPLPSLTVRMSHVHELAGSKHTTPKKSLSAEKNSNTAVSSPKGHLTLSPGKMAISRRTPRKRMPSRKRAMSPKRRKSMARRSPTTKSIPERKTTAHSTTPPTRGTPEKKMAAAKNSPSLGRKSTPVKSTKDAGGKMPAKKSTLEKKLSVVVQMMPSKKVTPEKRIASSTLHDAEKKSTPEKKRMKRSVSPEVKRGLGHSAHPPAKMEKHGNKNVKSMIPKIQKRGSNKSAKVAGGVTDKRKYSPGSEERVTKRRRVEVRVTKTSPAVQASLARRSASPKQQTSARRSERIVGTLPASMQAEKFTFKMEMKSARRIITKASSPKVQKLAANIVTPARSGSPAKVTAHSLAMKSPTIALHRVQTPARASPPKSKTTKKTPSPIQSKTKKKKVPTATLR